MRMFTPEEREGIRADLIERARRDPRISGGAITGSGSAGALDAWSDIDLAFGVRDAADLPATLEDFTEHMRRERRAVDTVDVVREPWIYRVFLLPSTLQVDLAFAPASQFGARAPTFRLAFGKAIEARHVPPPSARELIGYGWLYALHARSSIARGRPWQAEYTISAMRDQVLALACVRFGLPAREARGADALPHDVTRALEAALIGGLGRDRLVRAFAATTDGLVGETLHVDAGLASRLRVVLAALVGSVGHTSAQ
jgi:hypothetical protein